MQIYNDANRRLHEDKPMTNIRREHIRSAYEITFESFKRYQHRLVCDLFNQYRKIFGIYFPFFNQSTRVSHHFQIRCNESSHTSK